MSDGTTLPRLEIAAWRLCAVACLCLLPILLSEHKEWRLILANGLIFVQPVLLFAANLPRLAKHISALMLLLSLYIIYPAVFGLIGLTPRPTVTHGLEPIYSFFCIVCGLINAIFLGTTLLGRLLSRL
jgi:hypothetical protein